MNKRHTCSTAFAPLLPQTRKAREKLHEEFNAWVADSLGYHPCRDTEYSDEYSHPFTNGAWFKFLCDRKPQPAKLTTP